MKNEHKQIGDNLFQIMRSDRGEYDIVFDEENRGWYVETIVAGTNLRSKTYSNSQEAETAIKMKTVVCNMPVIHS